MKTRPFGSVGVRHCLAVVFLPFLLTGCLKFEMRTAIRPGGATDAEIFFNGPAWVMSSFGGGGGPSAMPTTLAEWEVFVQTSPMLKPFQTKPLLYAAINGENTWILGTETPDDMSLPFVKFNYEELGDRWTFVGEIDLDMTKAKAMQDEVAKRLALLPRLSEKRRQKMAGMMLSQAEMNFRFDFPGDVTSTNSTESEAPDVKVWKLPLSQWIQSENPPKVMFASGTIDRRFAWQRAFYALVSGTEVD